MKSQNTELKDVVRFSQVPIDYEDIIDMTYNLEKLRGWDGYYITEKDLGLA